MLEHLKGTYQLLASWKERSEVMNAGHFHSVYGTEVFKQQLAASEERTAISKLIGSESEQLTYYFSIMDRKSLWANMEKSRDFLISDR